MKLFNLVIALLLVIGTSYSQGTAKVISFNTEKVNNAVAITWAPSIEPETNYFEIQKSADGVNWKVIALMFPFEDASRAHSYKYNDKSIAEGNVYYRIRQIDMNKKKFL